LGGTSTAGAFAVGHAGQKEGVKNLLGLIGYFFTKNNTAWEAGKG